MKPCWKRALILSLCGALPAGAAHTQSGPVRDELSAMLQARLAALDTAQQQYRASRGSFAASTWRLSQEGAFSTEPGVTAVILEANADRWSAVAVHRAVPGFRCIRRVDRAAGFNEVSCAGEFDFLDLSTTEATDLEYRLAHDNSMRPECRDKAQTNDSGRVVYEGTIDKDGHLELRDLQVLVSPTVSLSYAGMFVITRCQFQPARFDGHRIPSRRLIPLNIQGTSQ